MLTPTSLPHKTDEYDALNHLRRGLSWEPDWPIVMLTFFADDSQKSDQSEYIHIAAYVGLAEQWESNFVVNWRLRLARAGLNWFHANEFFNGVGEFAGWNTKQREGERRILLQDLVEIIGKGSLFSFMCVVHVPSWRKLNEEFCLEERYLRPYPLAGRTIVKLAREWWGLRGNNPNEVQYFFDRDFEDWGMLCDRVRADLNITLQPANSREVRPLQAADWLAYESGKEAPQYYDWKNRKRKPRQSFLELLHLGSQPTIFQEKDIRNLCEDLRAAIPKRGIAH